MTDSQEPEGTLRKYNLNAAIAEGIDKTTFVERSVEPFDLK